MTEPSIDFDQVAQYYDLYVDTDLDLAFWVEEARRHPGERLELMCGTGRITVPILRAGMRLTCVDRSAGLLAVLREKLDAEGLDTDLVEMDIRELRTDDPFDWAFLGFHAFAELSRPADQRDALARVYDLLRPGGRFTLSLQNPRIRGAVLDGSWREITVREIPGESRRLRVSGRFLWDPETGQVTGEQRFEELEPDDHVARTMRLPVAFRLVDPDELEEMTRAAGFETVARWGDYDRSPFEAGSSPYLLCELERTGTRRRETVGS